MRILLTGATGFIGSHVARLALAEGHEVQALVRPGTSRHRIEDVDQQPHLIECALEDSARLAASLRSAVPDVCAHLAWYTEPGRYVFADENLDCLTTSLAFMRMLHDVGCPRLVLAGTSLEYAPSESAVTEASAVGPTTLYAAAKASLFSMARHLDTSDSWSVAAARIFSLYGPWEDPRRLVPFVITKLLAGERCALTAGGQVRDYSHVEDVASALLAMATSSVEGAVNVASSQPVTVAAIAKRVADILARPELLELGALPSSKNEVPFLVANTDRLRNDVGWKSRYDLGTGLAHTVDWWRSRVR